MTADAVLAAIEAGDAQRLAALLTANPELAAATGPGGVSPSWPPSTVTAPTW